MSTTAKAPPTFIIDCPYCKAKVAATESGRAECAAYDDEAMQPCCSRVFVGNCPKCSAILVGQSDQLRAFRNLAAHAEDISISRDDAEDLQTFVNAIVENVYDLADRYAEFKERAKARAKRKKS